MKTIFLSATITLCMALHAIAQMPYLVTTKKEAYQQLSGASKLNANLDWSDSNYVIPIGFNFTMGGKTVTNISFSSGHSISTDTTGVFSRSLRCRSRSYR